jgi:hypothetical protein
MCQLEPGFCATTGSLVGVVPFISHIAACPLVFCHKMSGSQWPLKSPAP